MTLTITLSEQGVLSLVIILIMTVPFSIIFALMLKHAKRQYHDSAKERRAKHCGESEVATAPYSKSGDAQHPDNDDGAGAGCP